MYGVNCVSMQHICYWVQLYRQQYDFPERCHCQDQCCFLWSDNRAFLWSDNRAFFNNSLTFGPAFLAHRRSAWRKSLALLSDPVDTKFTTLCLVSPRNPATHLGTPTHGRIKTKSPNSEQHDMKAISVRLMLLLLRDYLAMSFGLI